MLIIFTLLDENRLCEDDFHAIYPSSPETTRGSELRFSMCVRGCVRCHRHAYGDHTMASEMVLDVPGKVKMVFAPADVCALDCHMLFLVIVNLVVSV